MTKNIIDSYIKNTREFIDEFSKEFLAQKYQKKILKHYIDTYIDGRIYNLGDESQKLFYKKIYNSLVFKKNEIQKEYKNIDPIVLNEHLQIFEFIFYIDDVRPISDLENFVISICEKRESKFQISCNKNFKNSITKKIKNYCEQKRSFLESFESKSFALNIEKYKLIENTYKVSLDYSFKIPYIYSQQIIDEVYNEGTINEDKLKIEYILLEAQCLKDINKGVFNTTYLVDFPETLYKKEKKRNNFLSIIDNQIIQEKIILKIQYKEFKDNKELVYLMMRNGFKFALIINDDFKPTMDNIKKLDIFKYVLISKHNKNYEIIQDKKNTINSIIICDN